MDATPSKSPCPCVARISSPPSLPKSAHHTREAGTRHDIGSQMRLHSEGAAALNFLPRSLTTELDGRSRRGLQGVRAPAAQSRSVQATLMVTPLLPVRALPADFAETAATLETSIRHFADECES